ncbi:hypothetical protein [Tropicimonas sp. IMCC6043]|uniref:hypothetical protein n=1 Tax=Tropicimonas sp. IMCC6043 TaxID=2510645 RepID=UPI00101D15C7|nr:hypothetical protein [Tropicimonas sp. IMCC6043]RYH09410.1 hypothetical protein EU800_12085 [Tropicimonas sp. IMCC6043]
MPGPLNNAKRHAALPGKLGWVSTAFAVLGVGAAGLPWTGLVGGTGDLALMLALWGAAGIGLALAMRPMPEWRAVAAGFLLLLLTGLFETFAHHLGREALTMLVVLGLLAQGVATIILALRLSARVAPWRAAAASGLCALGVGLFMIAGWPDHSLRLVAGLSGVAFLACAAALLRLAGAIRTARHVAPSSPLHSGSRRA